MKSTGVITEEMIYGNPYNFTYSDMTGCMGEDKASALFHTLYKSGKRNQYYTLKIKEVYRGGDTQKYAFELPDGYCIETVCIKRKTGVTVCVSTMVGCPVGCAFCASGKNGFIRNLAPSEIVQQVMMVTGRINRIVFMGMGEPLLNYNNVIKSIHILRERAGLDFPTDGMTISTVGPVQQLKKLREEHLKIQLTLSLHATDQHTRDAIIPHMKIYSIDDVVQSVLSYSERHNRTVTIAYLLIPGLNDRMADVHQLKRWFYGKRILINLLQYNEINTNFLKRPNKQQLVAFRDKLVAAGLSVKIRESRGNNIKAACGQLVIRRNKHTNQRDGNKHTPVSGLQKRSMSRIQRNSHGKNRKGNDEHYKGGH